MRPDSEVIRQPTLGADALRGRRRGNGLPSRSRLEWLYHFRRKRTQELMHMNSTFRLTVFALASILSHLAATSSTLAAQVIVNFGTAPQNAFLPPMYYQPVGLIFGDDYFVTAALQSSSALVVNRTDLSTLPISAEFSTGVTSISIEIAPFFQGAASYQLAAFDLDALPIAEHRLASSRMKTTHCPDHSVTSRSPLVRSIDRPCPSK